MKYLSEGFRVVRSRKAASMWREECESRRKHEDAVKRRLVAHADWLSRIERNNAYVAQMSADQIIHEYQDGQWVRVLM